MDFFLSEFGRAETARQSSFESEDNGGSRGAERQALRLRVAELRQ